MTGKADNRAEKLLSAYYDYIGDLHLEGILAQVEEQKEEIDRVSVPESLDHWFKQYMLQFKKREASRRFLGRLQTVGTRVAAILFLLVASMLIVTISVDAIRVKVFNLMLENREKYSTIRVDEVPAASGDWGSYYYPAWVPEGFMMKEIKELSDMRMIEYTQAEDGYLLFTQAINGTEHQIDTENAKVSEVIIRDKKAILSEKPGKNTLFWNNDEYSFCLASSLNGEILVQIAQNVKKNK